MQFDRPWLAAGILALGIALAGAFAGIGFARGRASERYVTVKGVAERDVRADLAIWPLQLVVADDDLGRAHAELERDVSRIMAFLAARQVDTAGVELQGFSVSDARANQYAGNQRAATRFVLHQTVVVRSDHPERVLAASQHVGDLASAGVTLSSGPGGGYGPGGGPTFVFSRLNALKPSMIAAATARAREAAEQFARDSGSRLAGIRRANQGVFVILPRDQAPGIAEGSEIDKTVRVVSTVEYGLKE